MAAAQDAGKSEIDEIKGLRDFCVNTIRSIMANSSALQVDLEKVREYATEIAGRVESGRWKTAEMLLLCTVLLEPQLTEILKALEGPQ